MRTEKQGTVCADVNLHGVRVWKQKDEHKGFCQFLSKTELFFLSFLKKTALFFSYFQAKKKIFLKLCFKAAELNFFNSNQRLQV